MSLVLLDSQKVALSVQPIDAAGNPAKIDGVPAWSVVGANPEILALEVAGDGLSCEVLTAGQLGTAQVMVSADADLGEGVKTISGVLDIEVQGGEAVSLNVSAGLPEPK